MLTPGEIAATMTIAGQFVTVIFFFSRQSHDIRTLRHDIKKMYGEEGRPVYTYNSDCREKRNEICEMMKNHFASFSRDLEQYNKKHNEAFEKFDNTNIEARTKMFNRIEQLEKDMVRMQAKCVEFERKNV